MTNETARPEEKKQQPLYAGVGLILGVAPGFTFGGPVGAAMGAAIGLILGACLDIIAHRRVSESNN